MLVGGMERLLWVVVLGFWFLGFFFALWAEWEEGRENKVLREGEAVSEHKGVTTWWLTEPVNAAALG